MINNKAYPGEVIKLPSGKKKKSSYVPSKKQVTYKEKESGWPQTFPSKDNATTKFGKKASMTREEPNQIVVMQWHSQTRKNSRIMP